VKVYCNTALERTVTSPNASSVLFLVHIQTPAILGNIQLHHCMNFPLPFNPHHVTLIFESCPVPELSLSSTDNSAPSSPSIRSPEIPPSSCEDQIQMIAQTQN
jgi:hypothetical protein